MYQHPLAILSEGEIKIARDAILVLHRNDVVKFREIYLQEPPKVQLKEYLALEHSGRMTPTSPRPPRLALCQYDVIRAGKIPSFEESIIDITLKRPIKHEIIDRRHHASLIL